MLTWPICKSQCDCIYNNYRTKFKKDTFYDRIKKSNNLELSLMLDIQESKPKKLHNTIEKLKEALNIYIYVYIPCISKTQYYKNIHQ